MLTTEQKHLWELVESFLYIMHNTTREDIAQIVDNWMVKMLCMLNFDVPECPCSSDLHAILTKQ